MTIFYILSKSYIHMQTIAYIARRNSSVGEEYEFLLSNREIFNRSPRKLRNVAIQFSIAV